MIEIDIKIVPYGQRDKAKYLKRIQIANDGTRDIGKNPHNYTAEILDPEDKDNILTAFERRDVIEKFQHDRGDGALKLLYKALEKHFQEKK